MPKPEDPWTIFVRRANTQISTLAKDIRRIHAQINAANSSPPLKNLLKEVRRAICQLGDKLNKLEDLTCTMPCPNSEQLENQLNMYMRCFTELETLAEDRLEALNPTPPTHPTIPGLEQLGIMASRMFNVAQVPPIELPTFDGKSSAAYTVFKKKFDYIIRQCNVPEELWSQHLENNLIGEAATYVGPAGTWQNKYNELWKHLDQRYANRWNLCAEAVREFFFRTPPTGTTKKESAQYIYTQKSKLDHLISLQVSLEEIGVSTILQNLPEEHAREVRQALRTAHAKEDDKKRFSMDTLIKVTNDTLGIENFSATPSASTSISTLGLSSQINQNYGYGGGQKRGYQKSYPKKAAGKGKPRAAMCQIHKHLHEEVKAREHRTFDCPDYPTAKDRRAFWSNLPKKVCMQCLTIHDKRCPRRRELNPCPAPGCGEKHFQNLCDKRESELNATAKSQAKR